LAAIDRVLTALKSEERQLTDRLATVQAAIAALTEATGPSARRPVKKTATRTTKKARRKMTAGEKRAVSKRMKAYWAARKKARA